LAADVGAGSIVSCQGQTTLLVAAKSRIDRDKEGAMPKVTREAGTEAKTTGSRAAKKTTKASAMSKKTSASKKTSTSKKKPTSKQTATSKKSTDKAETKTAGAPIQRKARGKMSSATPISHDERRRLIAEAAYLRAEARGFEGGDPTVDWLEAEHEVDARTAPAS
jgi:hypothetical protein